MSYFLDLLKCAASSKLPVIVGAFKLKQWVMPQNFVLDALKNLVSTNTQVKLLLESRLTAEEIRDSKKSNAHESLKAFENTGAIILKDLPPYKNIHIKILLADNFALISTTNYDDFSALHFKRDFCILLTENYLISEIRKVLELAESGLAIDWPSFNINDLKINETRLSWGPTQHKAHILQLINCAQNNIYIYQQDIQDPDVVDALINKLKCMVSVFILMSEEPFEKPNKSIPSLIKLVKYGAKARLTGSVNAYNELPLHVHAKVLIIDPGCDHQFMYLGSANFYPDVLDPQGDNFNLGVITRTQLHIRSVHQTFLHDWEIHEGQNLKC